MSETTNIKPFESTCSGLVECLETLRQFPPLCETEHQAAYRMFRHFLPFCRDANMISGFDPKAIERFLEKLEHDPEGEAPQMVLM